MLPFFPGESLKLEKGYEPIGGCQGSFSVLSGKPGNWEERKHEGTKLSKSTLVIRPPDVLLEGIITRVWRKIIKVEAPVKQKGWEDDLLRTYSSWKEYHWRSSMNI
jgi:hypothetical protein